MIELIKHRTCTFTEFSSKLYLNSLSFFWGIRGNFNTHYFVFINMVLCICITLSFMAFLRALFNSRSASVLFPSSSSSESLSLSLSALSLPPYFRLRDFFFFDLLQIEWYSFDKINRCTFTKNNREGTLLIPTINFWSV